MSNARHHTYIGVWATLGEPRTAIALEESGAEWICLDAQHGHFDDRAVRETTVLRRHPEVPMFVRLLSDDGPSIGRALDSGADGVIVPMVESARQAAAAVRASIYPPHGTRSFGPMAGAYTTPVSHPADAPMVAVMIESTAALENLEDIAATPGLSMLFVGPFDLAISLGTDVDTLLADTRPESPLSLIADICSTTGIAAGAFGGSPGRARQLAARGFGWVTNCSDATLIAEGFKPLQERSTP